jgi:hypothetical protein
LRREKRGPQVLYFKQRLHGKLKLSSGRRRPKDS